MHRRLSRLTTHMTRIGHAPIPDGFEVIHDIIELLYVLLGEGNIQGFDIFAETEDPGSTIHTPSASGYALLLFLGSAKGNEVVALRGNPREAELTWGTVLLGGKLSVDHTSVKGIVDTYESTHFRLSTNFKFCSWI